MDLFPKDNTDQGFIITGNAFNDPSKLALLLMQMMIILFTCRMIALPFSYINQPRVIAEVIGGILLGPTALGKWGWFRNTFFPPGSMEPLKGLADLGLVLFMLLIGLEMDIRTVKANVKASVTISLGGFLAPFALSIGVSYFLYNEFDFDGGKPEFFKFLLFIGVAMSVTALPVLARILTEKKLAQSRMGVIILAAATVDDALCWILLALVIALIGSQAPIISLYIFLATFAFVLFMFLVVSPLLLKLQRHLDQLQGTSNVEGVPSISQPMVVTAFVLTLLNSFITNSIGVHTIFGGFITGLILPRENGFAVALTHRIEDFVSIILLPLYFTASGLKTDIGSLNTGLAWGSFFLVFFISALGKIGGCGAAAKLTGLDWRESLAIGCAMNTKGLVEIIILNIGLDNKLIPHDIFAMMVLFAITTTLMTSPMIDLLFPQIDYAPSLPKEGKILDAKDFTHALEKELNMVVAIPSLSLVPSTMHFLQYIQGATVAGLDDLHGGSATVHAARFLQINDRLSTVLMASNEQETITNDPAMNIFISFADLKHISVLPHLLVARIDDFPKDLAQLAYANQSELVVIPFQPAKGITEVTEPTSISAWLNGGEGPRPKVAEDMIVSHLNIIADQLIRKCRVKVAILVDAGVQKQSLNTVNILIPFFGGMDDRESILLALRIGSLRKVNIHVLHISIIDSESKKPINTGVMDLEDSKMIEFIQSLSKNSDKQCIVTYEKTESSTPFDLIMTRLEEIDYSLVVVGHFGPYWTLLMSEEGNTEEEQNDGTVWSLSKIQATISSLSSHIDKEIIRKNLKDSNSSLLEKNLGPTGIQIYNRNPSKASLLVLRKFRIPETVR